MWDTNIYLQVCFYKDLWIAFGELFLFYLEGEAACLGRPDRLTLRGTNTLPFFLCWAPGWSHFVLSGPAPPYVHRKHPDSSDGWVQVHQVHPLPVHTHSCLKALTWSTCKQEAHGPELTQPLHGPRGPPQIIISPRNLAQLSQTLFLSLRVPDRTSQSRIAALSKYGQGTFFPPRW